MRSPGLATLAALAALAALAPPGCQCGAPSPAEIADRSWRAHELVVAAGERSATCAEAGAAMRRVFDEHRQDFADGLALDRDRKQLEQATDYIAAHEDRYKDLETRMAGLSDRCAAEPTVVEVFRLMDSP